MPIADTQPFEEGRRVVVTPHERQGARGGGPTHAGGGDVGAGEGVGHRRLPTAGRPEQGDQCVGGAVAEPPLGLVDHPACGLDAVGVESAIGQRRGNTQRLELLGQRGQFAGRPPERRQLDHRWSP
ncbi:MAG: hypothetical protein R2710_02730 [Acidimicrobiales bacterium]